VLKGAEGVAFRTAPSISVCLAFRVNTAYKKPMRHLVKGIHTFQTNVFTDQRELFERLSTGQTPDALFITCSDSRINPNLLTQTEPGELFILRNAGNIVPPYDGHSSGEAATIEYAVAALGIRDIIVCGHSLCGAMDAVHHPEKLGALPAMSAWLKHAETTRRIVTENYDSVDEASRLAATIQENVLVQLEHLRTHPAVAARLATSSMHLHGWIYEIETGEVYGYDHASEDFVDLTPETRASRPAGWKPAKGSI
jgi:carbonic anhydrase